MNGLKLMSKKVVACLLTILLLAAPVSEPLFLEEARAAEVGMVGSLSGSTTLWEIFGTLFAGAGVIVANDNIQSVASGNLGSSAYTLEEMERLGFIRVPEGGSNALDWDWSGLEEQLENDTSLDTKIIEGVFSQNGGQGSGGNNEDPDEDPWYKKAVNWVKGVVEKGNVALSQTITGVSGQAELALASLATMLGSFTNPYIELGAPVSFRSDLIQPGKTLITGQLQLVVANKWTLRMYVLSLTTDADMSKIGIFAYVDGDRTRAFIVNKNSTNLQYIARQYSPGGETEDSQSSPHNLIKNYLNELTIGQNVAGRTKDWKFYGLNLYADETAATAAANQFLNSQDEIVKPKISPDIYTDTGNAYIPNGQPSWVPTPYINGNEKLEILPQPKIDEFTQYITEENPEFAPAGEAWVNTVDPYVSTEPTPVPTQRPQPTQKPDVTKIPDQDPGGEDNPINVTNPDPMPVIEGGFATTYGLMDFFPFCIPSDIVAIYKLFETTEDARAAPYIDWNIKIDRFGIDEHIVLDFSIFDSSAEVCRILMFITFCFGLLLATKQIIWS